MKTRSPLLSALALTLGGLLAVPALADGVKSYPLSAVYKEECGSCHVSYPAGLLSAASWRAVMAGLDRHFGSDASIDAARAREIGQFLGANAARQSKYQTVDAQGKPLLRITDGSWFKREHRDGNEGITAAVWKLPSVKSVANCAACHRSAEQGLYSENEISIPRS